MLRHFIAAAATAAAIHSAQAAGLDDANAGFFAQQDGHLDLAIHYYTKAIRSGVLTPADLSGVFFGRALVYGDLGLAARAVDDYDVAIALNPNNAAAHHNRGLAHSRQRRFDLAIADFDRAIGLREDYASAYGNRAVAHGGGGDYRQALADFAAALRLRPDDAATHSNRCYVHALAGHGALALADCDRALALEPDGLLARGNRALALFRLGDHARALAEINAAIAGSPAAGWEQLTHRAAIYLALARPADAAQDLAAARGLAPAPAEVDARLDLLGFTPPG